MKIAHLINYFQPKLGYQETFLAREQMKLGNEVRVFTSDRYTHFKDFDKVYGNILGERIVGEGKFIEEAIEVERTSPIFEMKGKVLFGTSFFRKVRDWNPDLIIVHNVLTFLAITTAFAFFKGPKIIYDDHIGGLYKTNFVKRLYYFVYSLTARRVIEHTALAIVGVTKPSVKFLKNTLRFREDLLRYVPLGVDTDVFQYRSSSDLEIRTRLGIREETVIGIYSGKIQQDKGIIQLVEGLKKIDYSIHDLFFIFIGNGEDNLMAYIQKELDDSQYATFPFMSHQELAKFYVAADFAIWPLKGSISQLEVMACKTALIVPNIRKERIQNDNGIGLENGSAEEICSAIESLTGDRAKLEQYKTNSVELSQNYSWATINKKFLDYEFNNDKI